jgi:3-phytase
MAMNHSLLGPSNRLTKAQHRLLRLEALEHRSMLAVDVVPSIETVAAASADDAALWIHPTDTSKSVIIGTAKESASALRVYDLAGNQLQAVNSGKINNVDLRYNFPLNGQSVGLVAGSNRSNNSIAIYKLNAQTGLLENAAARTISTGMAIYGLCMYHSPTTGKYYVFANSSSGQVQQWELFDAGNGKVDAKQVRSFSVGSQTEGCVADDVLGQLYIGEEDRGIWKYSAEPSGGSARTSVDQTGGGHLSADVEGLTIYYAQDGKGYLLASSQGSSQFAVYQRDGNNSYVGNFKVVAGNGIDAVTNTDGIDVTNAALGSLFPNGAFVSQDNDDNFKLTRWDSISTAFGGLLTDTTWDPRLIGKADGVNQTPQVNAGGDQLATLGASVALDGTASDDGLSSALATTWSVVSGPGDVTFASASSIDTSATFSAVGTYVLRLTADDSELSAGDEVTIQITAVPTTPQDIVFQDGVSAGGSYRGTRDTMLWGDNKSANSGTTKSIDVDGSPDHAVLIAWDVSVIPQNSTIKSAQIKLQITDKSSHSYPVYALTRAWEETQATWTRAKQGVNWATAGALAASDRGTVAIGNLTATKTGQAIITLNAAGVALVQSWVNNPATNFGILLQNYANATDGITFATREATSASTRPMLSVSYLPASAPGSSFALAIAAGLELKPKKT